MCDALKRRKTKQQQQQKKKHLQEFSFLSGIFSMETLPELKEQATKPELEVQVPKRSGGRSVQSEALSPSQCAPGQAWFFQSIRERVYLFLL